MTPRQIELARHALGLRPGCLVSHRNHYVAASDHHDWQGMVDAGYARKRYSTLLPHGHVLFHLTRAGAERALLPGDVLDPEDWGS